MMCPSLIEQRILLTAQLYQHFLSILIMVLKSGDMRVISFMMSVRPKLCKKIIKKRLKHSKAHSDNLKNNITCDCEICMDEFLSTSITENLRLRLTYRIPVSLDLLVNLEASNIIFCHEIETKHCSQLSLVTGNKCVPDPTVQGVEPLEILHGFLVSNSKI